MSDETGEAKAKGSDFATRRIERRTFVRGLGATIAAGLGLALLPGTAVATPRRRGNQKIHPDVCGLYCTNTGNPSGCPSGQVWFHCVSGPCGYTEDYCDSASRGSYCACNGCC